MRRASRVWVGVAWLFSGVVSAQPMLTLQDILRSTKLHHPSIKAAAAQREQVGFNRLEAEGAFDLRVSQDSLVRTSGFYSGWFADQAVTKPIGDFGAEFTGRYRVSGGSFPIYENYHETLTAGEASVGAKLSLLRNREIDSRRANLQNSETELAAALKAERLTVNNLLFQASNQYLRWFAEVQRLHILEDLAELANTRRNAIETRVANGDLAAITLTEFETTVLAREAAVVQAMQSAQQAAIGLSLYLRTNTGEPLLPNLTQSPKHLPQLPPEQARFDERWQRQVQAVHPALSRIDDELKLIENDVRLARNDFLPTLDLEVKLARDIGAGSVTLDGTESFVGLNLSVPLERRQAKASLGKAQAKRRELKEERRITEDRLTTDIDAALLALKNLKRIKLLTRDQAKVAAKLVRQEYVRFEAGDSDQFLLNARESQSASAQVAALRAEVDYIRQQIDLLALSANLADLVPKI